MEQKVHKWFESLASDQHPIEDLVTSDARMIDNINQACYKGFPAMKHRMQSVHESLPNLVEVGDVADTAHNCVAAHWRAGETTGTYVFKFNSGCMIEEVLAYADPEEEEFLEA
ncbi:hypothetical protein OEZ86_011396 [Tetradesmus obliquus]|uniref:Uncharacterized protein n=2 Tax=Tetradesmus obliquus TaxID=3088 RepID=A0ABY8TI98_TETOB|nr:hypothetical protein OEZ85_008238 [Tetradesmus obliquus]WIA28871.1 hypothetical protein OEZ86_011396 [Tetradesmus obliquus]|eukprot:jgi/Sobl393_1/108/SZX74847.1